MNTKFSYLLFLLVLMMFVSTSPVYAQDEIPGPELNNINNTEPNTDDEKLLLFENEGRSSKAMLKDTMSVRPAVTVNSKSKSAMDARKKEETDPLNFNFLYYIIQKFKAADLVD